MAGIYKRGTVFWGRVQRQGKERRISLGTGNRRIAEKRLQQWIEDMDAVAWGEKPPRTWRETWERFGREHFPTIKHNSAKRYAVSLKALSRLLDGKTIQQITTSLLSEFETMRRSEGASAPTIRRDLVCLSLILAYCEEWEWLDDGRNIVPAYLRRRRRRGLKESAPRTRYLSEEEETALITALSSPLNAAAVMLSIDTGLRDQEIFSLQWNQVDFDRAVITTTTKTKSGRARMVPLAQRSAQALAAIPRHITSPYVFCHKDGTRYQRMIKAFKTACQRANLPDIRWHDLRRTAGCRWLQRDNKPMEQVSMLLGHSSIAVTESRYAFLDAEAAAQIPAQEQRTKA